MHFLRCQPISHGIIMMQTIALYVDIDSCVFSSLEIVLSKKKPDDWQQVVVGDEGGKFVLDGEQAAAMEKLVNVSALRKLSHRFH